jgi:1-acyl-sn-glycerol-3-phosphate acyltransferase
LIINNYFIFFVRFMVFAGVIRTEVHGAEQLISIGNRIVIANHPSYLDIVILLSLVPNACCIVNSNLLSKPFIGTIISSAGFISANLGSEQVINDCVKAINRGCPLIIFPEGTRSVPGRAYKFHRGFAHVALKSGVDIQPVIIQCEPSLLAKGIPWYKIPEQSAKFIIDVKPPIKVASIVDVNEAAAITSRNMEQYFESYYSQEIRLK